MLLSHVMASSVVAGRVYYQSYGIIGLLLHLIGDECNWAEMQRRDLVPGCAIITHGLRTQSGY